MRETTGAVFDTLAQIHLIRGEYEAASRSLQKAREAYGDNGMPATRWYQWSLQRARRPAGAAQGRARPVGVARVGDRPRAEAPPAYALQAELIVVEALLASGLTERAQEQLDGWRAAIQPGAMSGTWGELLRLRGRLHAAAGRLTDAYHDFGQSVSVFELLGEKHQAGLSYLELGRLSAAAGAGSRAARYLRDAVRDLRDARRRSRPRRGAGRAGAACRRTAAPTRIGVATDGDDAIVRRLVDAAVLPALLAREAATALLEVVPRRSAAVICVQPSSGGLG